MAISVDIRYGIVFGKCDASDWIPTSILLTDAEAAIYADAVRLKKDLNHIPELQKALERAYDEIEDEEITNGIDNEDEYIMECQGCLPVDPDEINALVADRDEHALSFFGLTDLSDEELDEWDANDEEMPLIKDFDESFEPCSPFDAGWILNVEFVNPWG